MSIGCAGKFLRIYVEDKIKDFNEAEEADATCQTKSTGPKATQALVDEELRLLACAKKHAEEQLALSKDEVAAAEAAKAQRTALAREILKGNAGLRAAAGADAAAAAAAFVRSPPADIEMNPRNARPSAIGAQAAANDDNDAEEEATEKQGIKKRLLDRLKQNDESNAEKRQQLEAALEQSKKDRAQERQDQNEQLVRILQAQNEAADARMERMMMLMMNQRGPQ